MHEYQLSFAGESDAAIGEILDNPEHVRSEYIEFGKNDGIHTGLAVYLTPSNQEHFRLGVLRSYGIEFLNGLSSESYYNRFITGKPKDKTTLEHTVDHFLRFDGRYHTTIAVLHDDAMIGAVSAFEPKNESLHDKGVAEVSVTIADEYHRKGLGRLLLQRVIAQAIEDDFTHIIANFTPGNDASRTLIETILGSNNLVAGKNSLEERCYRLGVTNPADDSALEATLRNIAGPGITKVYPVPEHAPAHDVKTEHSLGFPRILKTLISSVVSGSHIQTVETEMQLTLDIEDSVSPIDS